MEGLQVFTCGSSAGGYASALFGAQLNADRIFVSSAQFFILPNPHYGPFVEDYAEDPERNRYYDLAPLLRERTNIFYNYPAHCPEDQVQSAHVKDIPGFYTLQINSAEHGKTFNGICWPYLLTMDHEKRLALHEKFAGQIVRNGALRREILPLGERLLFPVRKMERIAKRLLRIRI